MLMLKIVEYYLRFEEYCKVSLYSDYVVRMIESKNRVFVCLAIECLNQSVGKVYIILTRKLYDAIVLDR